MPNKLSATVPKGADLNRVFKALSDPTRRTVVQRLAQGAATAGSLAASFEMALPSFLQHMEMLEASGLVTSEKTGRTRTYRLSPKPLEEVEGWMVAQRAVWQQRLNQLDSYLDRLHKSRQTSSDIDASAACD